MPNAEEIERQRTRNLAEAIARECMGSLNARHGPAPNDILSGPYQHNAIVRHCVAAWMHGDCTWDQAMMTAVLHLVRANDVLSKQAVELSQRLPPEPLVVESPG